MYKEEFLYPMRMPHNCEVNKVSFRTTEAIKEVTFNGSSTYFERMMPCSLYHPQPDEDETVTLYISRAYMSNQVFVYRLNPTTNEIFLENLSFNVSILDELNSFDFPES